MQPHAQSPVRHHLPSSVRDYSTYCSSVSNIRDVLCRVDKGVTYLGLFPLFIGKRLVCQPLDLFFPTCLKNLL